MPFRFFVLSIFVFAILSPVFGADLFVMKSATVAGFVNKGGPKQDNINDLITVSLITFLGRVSTNITPYKALSSSPDTAAYLSDRGFNFQKAITVAQGFGSEQVIAGFYSVDESKNSIAVSVIVYNSVDGRVLFRKEYSGGAGLEIFDTLDEIISDVSSFLLGRKIDLGKIRLSLAPSAWKYQLFIDGRLARDLGGGEVFEDQFMAGQGYEFILRSMDGREMMRRNVTAARNETRFLAYVPWGNLYVKSTESGADIYTNGALAGKTGADGRLNLTGIEAGKDIAVTGKKEGYLYSARTVRVQEGDAEVVIMEGKAPGSLRLEGLMVMMGGGYIVSAGWGFPVYGFRLEPRIGFGGFSGGNFIPDLMGLAHASYVFDIRPFQVYLGPGIGYSLYGGFALDAHAGIQVFGVFGEFSLFVSPFSGWSVGPRLGAGYRF